MWEEGAGRGVGGWGKEKREKRGQGGQEAADPRQPGTARCSHLHSGGARTA